MRTHTCRAAVILVVLLNGPATRIAAAQAPTTHEPAHATGHVHRPRVEMELIGSTIFQSGLAAVRLGGSAVLAEAQYFGVADNDIGVAGLSWEFVFGGLRVMPGIGWAFGRENRPALAATARWGYEGHRWLSQGIFVQSLRAHIPDEEGHDHSGAEHGEEAVRYAGAVEGHVSLALGPIEAGPVVEHIAYREENAWKAGARGAWRLGRGFKIVSQVLAPDPELRVGLAWEP